jgi:hypothetical protein
MSQADAEWMAAAMGFGPQEPPAEQPQAWTDGHQQGWSDGHQQTWSDGHQQIWSAGDQQSWNDSDQYPAQHQQNDDRAGNSWGGQYGHGC